MPNADGTSDKNLLNLRVEDGAYQDFSGAILAPPDSTYTGIFKYSGKQQGPIRVTAGIVIGAKETAVDVNNGASNLNIHAHLWDVSACKYGFSNKGGALNNRFSGVVRGQAKECEVFQDNWSDQSHGPSTCILNLGPEDGKTPIRVRYIYNKPQLEPGSGPYKFIFPWPWLPCRWLIGAVFYELRRHPLTAKLFSLT